MSDNDSQTSTPSPKSDGPPWKLIGLLLVVVAVAIFFFQNDSDAPVQFLMLDGTWPVWLVIGVSMIGGVLLDRLGSWQWQRARRKKAAQVER